MLLKIFLKVIIFSKQLNEFLDALGFAVYKSEKKSDGYSPWEKINKNGNTNCN